MNNMDFLKIIKNSFDKYLETGSRSNEKLKILHGSIAADLKSRLGDDYTIHALGYKDGKEVNMTGRYMDKKVDIAIEKNHEVIAAIALKYVMSNYSQNSNNYFENMLGETANIRSAGKPYFQIVILPSKVPYFKKGGELWHMEIISKHNLSKYIKLSHDNIQTLMHTPNKTLIYLVDMPNIPKETLKTNDDYIAYYHDHNDFTITQSAESYEFGSSVIYNNYEEFIEKVCYYIKSI